jgi:photosystem I subunit 12
MEVDRSGQRAKNGAVLLSLTMLTQTEILIALVVAAHAGVLAVRLSFSLFKA